MHVEDATLWVHQVLVVLSFNLDLLHDDSIDHVHRLTFLLLVDKLVSQLIIDRLTILVDKLLLLFNSTVVDLVVNMLVLELWVFARSLHILLLVVKVKLIDLVVLDWDLVEETITSESAAREIRLAWLLS